MAITVSNQDKVPENLRKQLAVAVRSVQWSYAVFWSLSTTQQGVLEWGEGYYNGDIKTRKTVQAMEVKADKIGMQRSEQLRELYESLLEEEADQVKRPSAALSPEDLSDAEWYYLVCMSFVFNPTDGMPGGVIELGVTELVPEDASLHQHVKACLLDFSKPVCVDKSLCPPHNVDDDKDPNFAEIDHEMMVDTLVLDNLFTDDVEFNPERTNANDEYNIDSPTECSNECDHNHQTEDSFMLEGMNGGIATSQVESWKFIADEFPGGVRNSITSSDCISEAYLNHENREKASNSLNHTKLSSLHLGGGEEEEDSHYRNTLSAILKSQSLLTKARCFESCDFKSSFESWKRGGGGGVFDRRRSWSRTPLPQKVLKKVLFEVPLMYGGSPQSLKETTQNDFNGIKRGGGHVSDKRKEDEKFLALRSLVPCISEIDKATILSETIKYLRELEARVEELESCMDFEARTRRNHVDVIERTSDNYEFDKGKKSWVNKRKARDIDEARPEFDRIVHEDDMISSNNLKVIVKEQEVSIEMRCRYRPYILVDIMDAINNLHLDAHSVRSSTLDGFLTLTLNSKFRGTAIAPAGMIKRALREAAGRC